MMNNMSNNGMVVDPLRPPARPPKPKHLKVQESEPLYITTIVPNLTQDPPPPPPKIKGILKKNRKSHKSTKAVCSSTPNFNTTAHERPPVNTEDIGHFELDIEQEGSFSGNEESNLNMPLNKPNIHQNESKLSTDSFLNTNEIKKRTSVEITEEIYKKATHAAKIESTVGILHLIVIVSSIVNLIVMANLTDVWEVVIRRCPLYVEASPNTGVYWGNERMAPCHYASYMPALILIMSLTLIFFHGGILYSWRNGTEASKLLLSRTYCKVMFLVELLELAIALSVSSVIIDGVRQTCLSFQLNPWPDERPPNCKAGYQDRDHVYGISKTYSRLMTGMVTSTIGAAMLIGTTLLYLIRVNPCCRRKY